MSHRFGTDAPWKDWAGCQWSPVPVGMTLLSPLSGQGESSRPLPRVPRKQKTTLVCLRRGEPGLGGGQRQSRSCSTLPSRCCVSAAGWRARLEPGCALLHALEKSSHRGSCEDSEVGPAHTTSKVLPLCTEHLPAGRKPTGVFPDWLCTTYLIKRVCFPWSFLPTHCWPTGVP